MFAGFTPKRIQVIGNLPFGIASKLLMNMLRTISTDTNTPLGDQLRKIENVEMLLMFQKEVAEVSYNI